MVTSTGSPIYAVDRNAPPLRFHDEADGQYREFLLIM